MCEIGKALEMLDIEPLVLPAPLRKEQERPAEQPFTVEAPITEMTVEAVSLEKP